MAGLGAPQSDENVTAIVAWSLKENGNFGNAATFNPLNTTWKSTNPVAINGHGVQAYASYDDGLKYTLKTLAGNSPDYYGAIRNALIADAGTRAVLDEIPKTPWGTGAVNDSFVTSAKAEIAKEQ